MRRMRQDIPARSVEMHRKMQFLQRGMRQSGTQDRSDETCGLCAGPDYTVDPGISGNAARLRASVSSREIPIQGESDGLCRRGRRQARLCEGRRMQGNLGLTPVQAPCKGCADRYTGCHTDCTRYIAFRREADRYKQERRKDMMRCASTRGCMRTLRDANRARREGRQHY